MAIFQGSCVALITPFTEDGIDFNAYGNLIDWQIENGTHAILTCGTTGEPSTMTEEEQLAVMEYAINRVAKRVPVIASTGGNNTKEVISLSQSAEKMGADALLVVTPYYNKCTQNGLVEHYHQIGDSVEIPIIAYNVPARTGLNVQASTFQKMIQHKNVIGMKEASGNITQVGDMIRLCPDAEVISGEDALTLPVIAMGGFGVISVAANVVPKLMSELAEACLNGDFKLAREKQYYLNPLIDKLFSEVNPIPAKAALEMMGMCNGIVRMPLTPMEENNKQELKQTMIDCGVSL